MFRGHIETYPATALPSWEVLLLHDFSSILLRTPDTLKEISLTIRCIFHLLEHVAQVNVAGGFDNEGKEGLEKDDSSSSIDIQVPCSK
jgi:hypothetical protein